VFSNNCGIVKLTIKSKNQFFSQETILEKFIYFWKLLCNVFNIGRNSTLFSGEHYTNNHVTDCAITKIDPKKVLFSDIGLIKVFNIIQVLVFVKKPFLRWFAKFMCHNLYKESIHVFSYMYICNEILVKLFLYKILHIRLLPRS